MMNDEKQKVILLVEDEALIALEKKVILEKNGYKVTIAHSGEQAIQTLAAASNIDIILMDIDLGKGMDGTDAAVNILEHHDVPIVFISSHTEREIVEKTERITSYGYIVKNSDETVLLASVKMAFRLFEAKQKLVHSRDLMRYIIEHSRSAIAVFDRNMNYIYVSQRFLQEYKVKERNIIGKHHYDLFPNLPEKFKEAHRHALKGETLSDDDPYELEDGTVDWIRWECRPWYEVDGSIGGIIIYTEYIPEAKRGEQYFPESERRLSTLIDNLPGFIYRCRNDRTWTMLFMSDGCKTVTGYEPEDFLYNKKIAYNDIIHPDYREYLWRKWQDQLEKKDTVEEEYQILCANGQIRWVWERGRGVFAYDGRLLFLEGFITDITERKTAEEKIGSLLKEKMLLLKETHHRIKNNMGVINSLLTLQANAQENETIRHILNDAAGRVQSMVVLYDKLYRSETHHELSMKSFLPQLIEEIIGVFPATVPVKTDIRIEDFVVSAKILSPLGIIINELITNSLKYAFKDRDAGLISVSASKKNDEATLEYKDNGVGLPESISFENSTTFGLQLVYMLVQQIQGTVSLERTQGTKYIIRFRV